MRNIEEAIAELRKLNESVPRPLPLPSNRDVEEVELGLGVTFSPEYRAYLLNASDVVLGTLEPATITEPESHTHLPEVVATARDFGVPTQLLPFCGDNSDFYCLTPTGEVVFWSHNGLSEESWPSLAAWIFQVWIGEHA